jgi:cytochrome oxidase Cu insertion factor (SCO1/SenC/PrrC family)
MSILKIIRFLTLGAIVGLAGAWGYHFWQAGNAPDPAALTGDSIGGPFELVDQNGVTRRDTEFRGKFMLIYFGFTYCPDACPTALVGIAEALDQIGPLAARVQPIFVSIDPDRDTVEQMNSYVGAVDPRLIGLTGSAAQVAAAAKSYRVFYRKVTPPGMSEYLMDHTSLIYLMGPDGKFLAHFSHETPPERIAEILRRRLAP